MMVATETMLINSVAFGADVLDVEARLLSAGMYSPVKLFDAAVDYQLSGDSFADATYGQIFATLLGWAQVEGDKQPTATALKQLLPDVHADDWARFVWLECSAAGVDSYAREVSRYARLRDEARGHLRRVQEIIGDNTPARIDRLLADRIAMAPVAITSSIVKGNRSACTA